MINMEALESILYFMHATLKSRQRWMHSFKK